jgi:hypothetical protein
MSRRRSAAAGAAPVPYDAGVFGRRKSRPKPPPPPCPECGKPTILGGRFCRSCGWDAAVEERGEGHLDGVTLPEAMDDDAYADLLAEEGLRSPWTGPRRRRGLVFWLAAVALLAAFLLSLLSGARW